MPALPKVGVIIYTFDRIEDARINQEIIRKVWPQAGLVDVTVVHAYNGHVQWYPKKYLEDSIIRRSNPGHFQGAAELIDTGAACFKNHYPNTEYVIVLAADTWCVKPSYIAGLIKQMAEDGLPLATCAWNRPGLRGLAETGCATDFFIYDQRWASQYMLFPIKYQQFRKKYGELLLYYRGSNVSLEKLFFARFIQALDRIDPKDVGRRDLALQKILRMKEREPIHANTWQRHGYNAASGTISYHEPSQKRRLLKRLKVTAGPALQKLLDSKNLEYYNPSGNKHHHKYYVR